MHSKPTLFIFFTVAGVLGYLGTVGLYLGLSGLCQLFKTWQPCPPTQPYLSRTQQHSCVRESKHLTSPLPPSTTVGPCQTHSAFPDGQEASCFRLSVLRPTTETQFHRKYRGFFFLLSFSHHHPTWLFPILGSGAVDI